MIKTDKLKLLFVKHKIRLLFFLIFYVCIGTSSIWIPAIFYGVRWNDVAMGFLTIVLSVTGYATIEKILSYAGKKGHKLEMLVNLIAFCLPLLICLFIISLINSQCKVFAVIVSTTLYILSCGLWWYQNINNENLDIDEPVDALGGKF